MEESKEEDLKPLSHFEMGELCLCNYLEEYKLILYSGSFPEKANLQNIAQEICHIFNLLYSPVTSSQYQMIYTLAPSEWKLDGKFREVCLFPYTAHKFLITGLQFVHYLYMQVMKGWLSSIVDTLQAGATRNTKNQLVSAVCVAHCLGKINLQLDDEFSLPLVRMLYLQPDLERKECPDYQYLCDFLPEEHR